jgi:hypothetical protein
MNRPPIFDSIESLEKFLEVAKNNNAQPETDNAQKLKELWAKADDIYNKKLKQLK